jgi:hypothetical protein
LSGAEVSLAAEAKLELTRHVGAEIGQQPHAIHIRRGADSAHLQYELVERIRVELPHFGVAQHGAALDQTQDGSPGHDGAIVDGVLFPEAHPERDLAAGIPALVNLETHASPDGPQRLDRTCPPVRAE